MHAIHTCNAYMQYIHIWGLPPLPPTSDLYLCVDAHMVICHVDKNGQLDMWAYDHTYPTYLPYGHMGIWTYGHVSIWSYVHIGIWACEHMSIWWASRYMSIWAECASEQIVVVWTYDHMDTSYWLKWTYGHMTICSYGHMRTYGHSIWPFVYGHMFTWAWAYGHIIKWSYGHMDIQV